MDEEWISTSQPRIYKRKENGQLPPVRIVVNGEVVDSKSTQQVGVVRGKRPFAVFKKHFNERKLRCLLMLYFDQLGGGNGLTLKELARQAGVNYQSLSTILKKWVKYKYIKRRRITTDAGECYQYSIDEKGMRIIRYAREDYPEFYLIITRELDKINGWE